MLFEHQGKRPVIHPAATVAPSAVVVGDVTVGPETRILHGAVVTAEGGPVLLGRRCIVMEQAVLRGTTTHELSVGDNVLIGPHAHLSGCTVEDNVFVATGAAVFNGARIGVRSVVRINAIVHLSTELPPDSSLPIGSVAIGRPPEVLPLSQQDRIAEILKSLEFSKTVFGVDQVEPGKTMMPDICGRYCRFLAAYDSDTKID